MAMTLERPATGDASKTRVAVIDCDIHTTVPSGDTYLKYMPKRWHEHHKTFGGRGHSGAYYPRMNLNAARTDSWPPSGLPPGSDLEFLRYQLLDTWGMDYGIMTPLNGAGGQLNLEYGAALARATNEWQAAEWADLEPRLRCSVITAYEDGDLAAEEIHRVGDDARFVQVLLVCRTAEPLGRRKYWKMFEAAQAHDLPIAIHFGGSGGSPITGAGFPSFYMEDHTGMPPSMQAQVVSLVCEGVFERFPKLKIVLVEGGFAWLPPLMWRLDASWKRLQAEVPHLKRLPSEYIREHFWMTTQPMEEPHNREDFKVLLDHIAMPDRLMFATDYPHWDFDAPDEAIPTKLDDETTRKIMAENARALYNLA